MTLNLNDKTLKFSDELAALLNRYSIDNDHETPDYILANYIRNCLHAYNVALKQRASHFDKTKKP